MLKGKYLFIIIIIIFCSAFTFNLVAHAFMLGPSFPVTGVDDTTEGSFTWSNTSNVTAEDGSFASVVSGTSNGNLHSHYLKATNFGFSIPKNGTVVGVLVEIKRQYDAVTSQVPHDAHIYLVKGGVIQTGTTDHATTTVFWPSTFTYATYGSASDMWGNTLSSTEVNSSGFGVAVNITGDNGGPGSKYSGDIDAVRISVTYTTPGYRTMASAHYSVQSDTINFAGGLSTSTSYAIQDTVGEVGTGISTSTNYTMNAGYQQMLQSYIAMSPAGNSTTTLANISGLLGGTSAASSTWTVTTDNPAGYSLSVQASTNPAMKGSTGDNVADYVPAGAAPDLNFTILPSQSAFGFSPTGIDAVQRYLNDGASCNAGVFTVINNCWDGFATSSKIIAQGLQGNQPNGATTTMVYKAQLGSARNQSVGTYTATITVTAVTL